MADEGTALVSQITRYLNGEITRDDLDKGATKDWLRAGLEAGGHAREVGWRASVATR
jgi:hypothetical protein